MPTEIEVVVSESHVFVPAQIIWLEKGKNAPISFLLDTGAEITSLSEADLMKMDLDFKDLKHSRMSVRGIGGKSSQVFEMENAMIMFPCGKGSAYQYDVGILQVVQNPQMKDVHTVKDGLHRVRHDGFKMPSLLGIDFFKKTQAKLIIDFGNKTGKIVTPD